MFQACIPRVRDIWYLQPITVGATRNEEKAKTSHLQLLAVTCKYSLC